MKMYTGTCECGNKIQIECPANPRLRVARQCNNCGMYKAFYFGVDHEPDGYRLRDDTLNFYDEVAHVFSDIQDAMTVRQVFYQLSSREVVPKTEAGYRKVATQLAVMRERGYLPYEMIVDRSRWMRKPNTYDSWKDMLNISIQAYRKALWIDQPDYVEVWCEKDALAGVIMQVTSYFDVPLMVSKGFASLTYIKDTADNIKACGKPAYIYHFGDYDPSGVSAAEAIRKGLNKFGAHVHFTRVAITPQQIEEWNLPTRPTKKSDTRAKKFGSNLSCELDALTPDQLKGLVRDCILNHLDEDVYQRTVQIEEAEKETLKKVINSLSA